MKGVVAKKNAEGVNARLSCISMDTRGRVFTSFVRIDRLVEARIRAFNGRRVNVVGRKKRETREKTYSTVENRDIHESRYSVVPCKLLLSTKAAIAAFCKNRGSKRRYSDVSFRLMSSKETTIAAYRI